MPVARSTSVMPPRALTPVALTPRSPSTQTSPKLLRGPVARALLIRTTMPSSDSRKSRPSCAGSNCVVALVSTLPSVSLSMMSVGGTRPPLPSTVGAITVLVNRPLPVKAVTVGVLICVTVRLVASLPGRNSATVPETSTWAPTAAAAGGADEVNTKMPSEVASLPSPSPSCM